VADDDLARWAAARASALLARAEAEAVMLLRDALVSAAISEPATPPAARKAAASDANRPMARRDPDRRGGELLWTYGVLRADAAIPANIEGIASSPVGTIEAEDLLALASRVPAAEFGPEPLRENLNDLAWLEGVARAHEEVLERALAAGTLLPLRLCTIYETEQRVRDMLEAERGVLGEALDLLDGRQEWGAKLLVDPDKLADEARARSPETSALEEELGGRSAAGAYMLDRRLERHVREAADSLAADVAEQVHTALQDLAVDAVTRRPQNRELSGHHGEMLLNAAYLVEAEQVTGLAPLVAELEERYGTLGARIELTGPWPPYNFVPRGGTAALA
jgi:hypothetical protein